MPDLLTIVVIVAGGAAWLLCKALRSPSRNRGDLDWLPTELHDAKLVWSEKTFRSDEPLRVAVRIDRAYREPDGELFLIEFKRRAQRRIQLDDVVELSVQRYVLRLAGHAVNRRAYVVIILPDGTRSRAMSVDLENTQQVERRAARVMGLLEQRLSPSGPMHPAVCTSCGHRNACPRSAR